jgi:hypothetical protein
MPRPNQAGALHFDKTNITDFLRRWNIECEDYSLTDEQKCDRIIDYCAEDVQDVIKLLDGYTTRNWETLQAELKKLYWQYDKQKGSSTALNQLINDAPTMDLNIYILRYASISDALVKKGALSTLDRVGFLLDGLLKPLRDKVIEFCTEKDWRLSPHDTGSNEPNFDQLKAFILTKAQADQKKIVYKLLESTRPILFRLQMSLLLNLVCLRQYLQQLQPLRLLLHLLRMMLPNSSRRSLK